MKSKHVFYKNIYNSEIRKLFNKSFFVHTDSNFTVDNCKKGCNDLLNLEEDCTNTCICIDYCFKAFEINNNIEEYQKCSEMCITIDRGE